MKFVYPGISKVFDTAENKVNTLIIENQILFTDLLNDLIGQLNGFDGKAVVSEKNTILQTDKNAEALTQFVPFEINKKPLINKLISALGSSALSDDHYGETTELLSAVERYMNNISFEINCDIDFKSIEILPLIKALSPEFKDDYVSLGEKIIDYFELVTEFERKKLFITVNLRSYISDEETYLFIDTVLSHRYNVIMIESSERKLLDNESRFIVDESLCEIC